MGFRYENLEISELAKKLINKIYQITCSFPKEEMFGLISQLRRASVSVLLNIAEGSGRYFKKDFARFIRNSIGSLMEVDAAINIATDQEFLQKERYNNELHPLIKELFYKLIAFEKSLIGKRD